MENETESYVGGNPFYKTTGNTTTVNTTSGITQVNGINNTTTSNYFSINTGTGTYMDLYGGKELKDVIVTEETIEILYIKRALYSYTSSITIGGNHQNVMPSDIAIKEIYGAKDGKLVLVKTIEGRVIPPQSLPESYDFDE